MLVRLISAMLAAALLLALPVCVFAQEAGPEDAKPQSGEQPAKPKSSLTEQLFKRLTGAFGGEEEAQADPLESAIQHMRDAQTRIAGRDTSAETQEVQKQIVKDLEKLIEQAKQQPPPNQPPPQPQPAEQQPQNPQDQQAENQPQQQADRQPQNRQQQADAEENASGRREKEDPQDSSEEVREAERREAERRRREQMVKDVWGHLPPALRQKLLNINTEKYLPRYDEQVRRYFESIAEPGDESRRR